MQSYSVVVSHDRLVYPADLLQFLMFNFGHVAEKVIPLEQEGLITASDLVTGAIMFGRGRSQCGVLIEPHPDYAIRDVSDEAAVSAFRDLVW